MYGGKSMTNRVMTLLYLRVNCARMIYHANNDYEDATKKV